jgi:phosphatidylserine decarboxylase
MESQQFPAWAEGRLWVDPQLTDGTLLPVKGARVGLSELLGDKALAHRYRDGAAAIIRLSPVDYHRFHFPDGGIPQVARLIPGRYHSVNHVALSSGIPIYCLNRRAIARFASDHFGEILLIEVGAMGISRIRQAYQGSGRVERGQEKGYFKFGGSTVIALFEPQRIRFDDDLIRYSAEGYESLVKLGEQIGVTP